MNEAHDTHVIEEIFPGAFKCTRCNMCSCHTGHKLIEPCERIDGRVKTDQPTND